MERLFVWVSWELETGSHDPWPWTQGCLPFLVVILELDAIFRNDSMVLGKRGD
jgi:hypothetical protein